jgi:putative endonuclease
MALHNELGVTGEQLAEKFLNGLGYTILERNWRNGNYEIDIVAAKNNILHFIEVKTRRSHKYGFPEEGVDKRKLRCLIFAGDNYLQQHPHWKRIQFDIVAITFKSDVPEYFMIEDVYL